MDKAQIKYVDGSDKATLYTIEFENESSSELEKFMDKFSNKAELVRDYQLIMLALKHILENGALERYFRPEGKINDNVCALPIESGKLRLYCLRLSDKIVIIGNGGIKNSRTYNTNPELSGYVLSLQDFDRILKIAIKKGDVTINETVINGIDNKYFGL